MWYGTTWDPRRAYLSFPTFVGTGLSWFYFMFVVDGSYWLDLILNVGLPVSAAPEFQAVGCFCHHGRLSSWMSKPLVVFYESPTSHQALRWTISFIISGIWLGVHGQVGVHGQFGGLDFPVRGIPVPLSS